MVPDFYTVADVAKRLKLTDRYIRKLIAAGTLPAYRFGRAVRIPADELQEFVEARKIPAQPIAKLHVVS